MTDQHKTVTIASGVPFYDEFAEKTRYSSGDSPFLETRSVVAIPAQDGGIILCDRRMFEMHLNDDDEFAGDELTGAPEESLH